MQAKKTKSSRQIGLDACNKLKSKLKDAGLLVEGPGFKPMYIPRRKTMIVVHKDYFDAFDLLVFGKHIYGIQVTADSGHVADKVKNLSNFAEGFVIWPIKEGRSIEYKVREVRAGENFRDLTFEEFLTKCHQSDKMSKSDKKSDYEICIL